MFQVSRYPTRNKLPAVLQEKGLTAPIVEIGVDEGKYARVIVNNYRGQYIGIDPWGGDPAYLKDETQVGPLRLSKRQEAEKIARSVVERHNGKLIRAKSHDAVGDFADNSLAMVYIDGDHKYPGVKQDLFDWWPKVMPGGFLAGHDIICPNEVRGGWGQFIQPAVIEFMQSDSSVGYCYLVLERDGLEPWSFYFVKGEQREYDPCGSS